jgi:hypothetical protein
MFDRAREWMGETFWNGFYDVTRAVWYGPNFSALRSLFSESFFQRPAMDKTVVNFDLARSLYRNDNPDYNLGAGFVRPIIDLPAEYMGMPSVSLPSSTDSETLLNECITDYWAPQLQQIFRDSMRDSKVYVRFRQPNLSNPLFTEEDRRHGKLELIPPEECQLSFSPSDQDFIDRAAITHYIEIDTRTDDEILRGMAPRMEEHEVIEIITPTEYSFFDKTQRAPLTDWTTKNPWGFVPIWPVWNEFAADLGGGQSDIEPILPFIQAFHEVLEQALSSHKYHSTPKAMFKIKDVSQFLENNFPGVLDENGKVKQGAKVDWSGREIFFLNSDDDAGFVEATSVLGDSKTLLGFLLDCIAVASETPKWALLSTDVATQNTDATIEPFQKKIERKRNQYSEPLVMICKMALAAYGQQPYTPRIIWPPIRLYDLVSKGQAIQQLILGFDIAAGHEWIADETVIKILATLFSEMNAPGLEKSLAADNVLPVMASTAPASDTQALPPAKPSTNGSGSKTAAQKALATTSASRS